MELYVALILWVLCGLAAGWIAQSRGAAPAGWFATGFLLGPVGILGSILFAGRAAPPWLRRAVLAALLVVLGAVAAVAVLAWPG